MCTGVAARAASRAPPQAARPGPAVPGLLPALGNPGKLQEASKLRESLVFLTTNGMVPWDPRADSMKSQTDAMIAAKEQEERLALEAAKKPAETIDAADKPDRDSEVPEGLELVQAPPEDFGSGRSRR